MTDGSGEPGADPVAELEAFIARTEASGEPVPPEARIMLARLRALMTALNDLRTSLGEGTEPPAGGTDGPG